MIISELLIPIAHAQEAAANTGVAGTLGLNVKIFLAQLVNFVIILFVLWKWVFTPVAKKLQERTDKIEKSLNDADRIAKEKQEFQTWREQEMTQARKQASEIITSSQTEAQKLKDQMLSETKAGQAQLVEQAKQQITQEKQKALQEAKGEIADLVTGAAEKILKEKLTSEKDQKFIKETLHSIK